MSYRFKPDGWPATVIDGREYVTYPSDQINELISQRDKLLEDCKAVVARWDSPAWKDLTHTAVYINQLRATIEEIEVAK